MVTDYDPTDGFGERFARFGGPGEDHGTVIEPLGDGTFLISGYSRSLGTPGEDAFVMKVTAFSGASPASDLRRRRVR